jgi:hypothetical protein
MYFPHRAVALVLSATLVAPSVALAQTSRAGVVTTLEGNVTARRVAFPDPVPLKFRDDVFIQDTVTTGDKSLARMLLGGKAVVTVRERSTLTITELPGRSTIELSSGKFALAVAREKMKPGEEILIRTPNAIAGVRGTVVVTEVTRQTAQLGGGSGPVLTNFFVLKGSIVAQPLDANTRQPIGTPLPVGKLEGYSGVGSATPRVAPVAAEQVTQITAGLQPSGPKRGGDAGTEQVKAQHVETAAVLIGAITGGPKGGPEGQAAFAAGPPKGGPAEGKDGPKPGGNAPPPINPLRNREATAEAVKRSAEGAKLALAQFGAFTGSFAIAPGVSPATFAGTTVNASTGPLFALSGGVLTSGHDIFFFPQTANLLAAGPLATITHSTLVTSGALLGVRGTVASTSTAPFIALDPGMVTAGGSLLYVDGGTLSLAGPLFTATGSALAIGGPALVAITNGAVVASSTTLPLLSFTNVSVDTADGTRGFLLSNATLSLAGPLASISGIAGGDGGSSDSGEIFAFQNGAKLIGTGSASLISLDGADIGSDGNFIDVSGGTTLELQGPMLAAANSTIDPHAALLQVTRSSVSSTSGSALISVTNSTVRTGDHDTTSGFQTAGRFVHVVSANPPSGTPAAPASLTLAGPLLAATGSTLSGQSVVGVFGGARLASTTSGPLVSLDGTSLTLGTAITGAGTFPGEFLSVGGTGSTSGSTFASVALAGPLLGVGNGSAVSTSGSLVRVASGGQIVETHASSPFVAISGGTHAIASGAFAEMFHLEGRSTATASETHSDTTLTLGTDEPLKRSGAGATLDVSSSASVSTNQVLWLDKALLAATAPLIAGRTGATLTSAQDALNLVGNAKLTSAVPLVKLDAATLNVTSGAAVRVTGSSLLALSGDLFSLANGAKINVLNGGALYISGNSVVTINGALVNFGGSGGNQLNITNSFTPNGGCSAACGGLSISTPNGGSLANVNITNPIKNGGLGSVSLGGGGSHIIVDGPNAKITISGN